MFFKNRTKSFVNKKDKLISVFSKIPAIVIKVSAKKMTRNHGNSGTFGGIVTGKDFAFLLYIKIYLYI